MKVFLAALLLVGIGVFGMCVSIIVRKDGHFPDGDISSNKDMRRLGIRCMKEEDDELWGEGPSSALSCDGEYSDACRTCAFNTKK